jgi:hypothetical protein
LKMATQRLARYLVTVGQVSFITDFFNQLLHVTGFMYHNLVNALILL